MCAETMLSYKLRSAGVFCCLVMLVTVC